MIASCSHPKPPWCICASPWPCSTHVGRPRCPPNSSQIPHAGQWQPQPHSCSASSGGLPSPKTISQHFVPTDPQPISELPNRMPCHIICICTVLRVPESWLGSPSPALGSPFHAHHPVGQSLPLIPGSLSNN